MHVYNQTIVAAVERALRVVTRGTRVAETLKADVV